MVSKRTENIIVTRPGERGQALVDELQGLGFTCHYFEVMAIQAIKVPTIHWADYQKVVVTSQNVITHLQQLTTIKTSDAKAITWLAIGETSQRLLEQALPIPVITPPKDQQTSEGLLALKPLQKIKKQNILLLKGERGRDLLPKTLQARGATLDQVAVYKRIKLEHSTQSLHWLEQLEHAQFIVTSEEIFLIIHDHLQAIKGPAQRFTFLTSSDRIAEVISDLGYTVSICQRPDNHSIISFLQRDQGNAAMTNDQAASEQATSPKSNDQDQVTPEQTANSDDPSTDNEQEKQENIDTEETVALGAQYPQPKVATWPVLLFGCIALAALILAGIVWYQSMQTSQQLQSLNNQLAKVRNESDDLTTGFRSTLTDIENSASSIKARTTEQLNLQKTQVDRLLDQQTVKLDKFEQRLQGYEQQRKDVAEGYEQQFKDVAERITNTNRNLQSLSGQKRSQWLLSEAYYLTKIASQRLFISRDLNTAIDLITEADNRMVEIGDTSFNYIRTALAEDLQTLKSIPIVDTEGIVVAINALIPKLESMALVTLTINTEASEEQKPLDQQVTGWRANLNKLLTEIKNDWIIVRRYDHEIEPLITPQEHKNLNLNIILSLQQAQIAALKQKPTLYEQSIDKAIKWIKGFYLHNDKQSAGVVASLETLRAKPIEQKIPKQLKTGALLESLVNTGTKNLGAKSQ